MREAMPEVVARRIKELRKARSLTQEAVAERAGLNPKYHASIEQGRVNVTIATLAKIARALDVPASDLLLDPGHPAKDDRAAVRRLVEAVTKHGDGERVARLRTFLEKVFR